MGRRFCAYGMRHSLPLWGLCLLLCAWGMPVPAGDGVQAKEACFASTTPDQMADGSWRPIAAVRVGDQVRSRDQFAPESAWKPATVTRTHVRSTQELVRVHLHRAGHTRGYHKQGQGSGARQNAAAGDDDGGGSGSGSSEDDDEPPSAYPVLTGTAEHPVWVVGTGWTMLGDLAEGDQVLAGDSGALSVQAVFRHQVFSQPVCNLTIEGLHTYVVAAQVDADDRTPVWVHNTCLPLLAAIAPQVLGITERDIQKLVRNRKLCAFGEGLLRKLNDEFRLKGFKPLDPANAQQVEDLLGAIRALRRPSYWSGDPTKGIVRQSTIGKRFDKLLAAGGNNRYFRWLRTIRDKLQVHHLIPETLSTKQVAKELCDTGFEVVVDGRKRFVPPLGWDVNDPARSILLSTKEAFVKVVGRVLHRGGHIQYNNAWERVMRRVRLEIRNDLARGASMEDAIITAKSRLDMAMNNARREMRVERTPLCRRLSKSFSGKGEGKFKAFEDFWFERISRGVFP